MSVPRRGGGAAQVDPTESRLTIYQPLLFPSRPIVLVNANPQTHW